MVDAFDGFLAISTFAIAIFAIVFCLMQQQNKRVYRAFALFLCAVAINGLPLAFQQLLHNQNFVVSDLLAISFELFGGTALAPTFWLYVFVLTSKTQKLPKRLYRHFALPSSALVLCLLALPWHAEIQSALAQPSNVEITGPALIFLLLAGVLGLALYPQLAIYIFLFVRRLVVYRKRLKDIYSSTEKHELHWIIGIGLLSIGFWLAQAFDVYQAFANQTPHTTPIAFKLVAFLLFLLLTLWGMRQQPSLVLPPHATDAENVSATKYERSALSRHAVERIAKKLRAAMETDKLHLDPNLTLWALAQHIGTSSNYISQTLNEHLEQNFFDFVNAHRIEHAQHLLANSQKTILAIAFESGFNSRSSFYTAFKKVIGETPSAYRKKLSECTGPDDKQV